MHRDEPRRKPRALLEWEEPQYLDEEQVARAQEYLQYEEDERGKARVDEGVQVVLVDERHQELVAEKDYFDGGDGWSRWEVELEGVEHHGSQVRSRRVCTAQIFCCHVSMGVVMGT